MPNGRLSDVKAFLPLLLSARKFSGVKLKVFSVKVGLPNSLLLLMPLLGIQTMVACAMPELDTDSQMDTKNNSSNEKKKMPGNEIRAEPLTILIDNTLLLPKNSKTSLQ
jgi:hypothetical protein